jgi:hypothetical protein
MSSSWFSRLQKRLAKRARPATPRRLTKARLELEALEERRVMSAFLVVPGQHIHCLGSEQESR